MRSAVGTLLAAIALTVGCLGEAVDDAPVTPSGPAGNATGPSTPTAGAPPSVPGANATGAAMPLVLYLDAGPSLSLVPPAEGKVPVTLNFLDPRFQAQQASVPPWTLASALPGGIVAESMTFDVFYSSDSPQASYRAAINLGSFAMFFGEEGRVDLLSQFQGPDALAPGEIVHAAGEVELAPGGFALEAGASPSALIGFTYTQNDGAPVNVHVGGADASRITLMVRPYAPAFGEKTTQTFESAIDDPNGGTFDFPIEVGGEVERIVARLVGEATLSLDVDAAILSPGEDRVGASYGPGLVETAKAYGPNFAAGGLGTYVVRVTVSGDNTGGKAGGSFTLDVDTTARAASPS